MSTRLTPELLRELFGADVAEYWARKGRGGANNAKGQRYEQFFVAHRIARLARKLFNEGVDAQIEWQAGEFVDDVVIRSEVGRSFKGYQLKAGDAVRWGSGERPIATDFERQYVACTALGYENIRLRLVCANHQLVERLIADVPDGLRAYTKTIFFPYGEALQALLYEHPWMADDFGFLSRRSDWSVGDAAQVATSLLGGWMALGSVVSVSAVIERVRQSSPTLLRAFRSDEEARDRLIPQVMELLDAIPKLQYTVQRGFLSWSALGGTTSGILSYDCFSERFTKFQEQILKVRPTSFAEIEGLLL